jgi:hypothetical protein
MQHDDCLRLVWRRPIGDRIKAFAVGDNLAANAFDPSEACHWGLENYVVRLFFGGLAAILRRRHPQYVDLIYRWFVSFLEYLMTPIRETASAVLRSASTQMLIVMSILW